MKNLGYILAAVIALLALGVLWRARTNEAVWSKEQQAYADSLFVVRSDFARAMAASAELDSTIDDLIRQVDSLRLVRRPLSVVILESEKAVSTWSVDSIQQILFTAPTE